MMAKVDHIEEVWKPVVDFEGYYEVSNMGKVRSKDRIVKHNCGGSKRVEGKTISQLITRNGYCQVFLWKHGKRKVCLVHRLVLHAFVGECPENMEVRHLNSIPTDNRLENLAYGTRSENTIDTLNLGRGGRQRLNPFLVKEIRKRLSNGEATKVLAQEYEVSTRAINKIKNRTTYAWV